MFNSHFKFSAPVTVYNGNGSIEVLKDIVKDYHSLCVVSGKNAVKATSFDKYIASIASDKEIFFFNEVEENPSVATVMRGSKYVSDNGCDLVIAVGGGSSIDASKAIAFFAVNEQKSEGSMTRGIDIVAIPTTCGTGSESNNFCILTDDDTGFKTNFSNDYTYPKFAILDSNMLKSLPKKLLYATSFDAFTHAFEGYISKNANPFSDTLALEAMEMIISTLTEDDDLGTVETLGTLLYASSIAGIVIGHAKTTLLHAMGYYLTERKLIHHGTANLILMPYYDRMLTEHNVHKYQHVKTLMGMYGFCPTEFLKRIGGRHSLKFIMSENEIAEMAAYSCGKTNALITPFDVQEEYVREVLLSALE